MDAPLTVVFRMEQLSPSMEATIHAEVGEVTAPLEPGATSIDEAVNFLSYG